MSNYTVTCTIRPATPADVPTIFQLIQSLADYENLSHEVVGTTAALEQHIFGPAAFVDVLLAEVATADNGDQTGDKTAEPVGFALFFRTYSTYRTAPGLYLEDLFVKPEYRRQGIGKSLFVHLARWAMERNYPFVEWSVLDWNESAIAFYQRIGAIVNQERRVCRITGESLYHLAQPSPSYPSNDLTIAPATTDDILPLFQQIQSSAAFHGAPDQVIGSMTNLQTHLTAQPPLIEALIAKQSGIAGIATFSHTYSTFLTQPGLYLEDLFVTTDKRRQGIGTSLLCHMAKIAVERDCGRLEWLVDVTNEKAIAFYQQNGAIVLPDWRRCTLADHALEKLAAAEV
ncbi:MAG: N-acetyltransferase family protein [Leptolyngbyaceae cyanobacterium]